MIPPDVVALQAAVNWRENYTVTYAFSTDVIVATNGTEQRLSRRRAPRKTLAFTASMLRGQARVFEGQVNRGQGQRYVVAESPMAVPMPQGMAAGSATLTLPSVPSWAVETTLVVLRDGQYVEARSIQSVTDTAIVFAETSGYAWPATAFIAPGRVGQVQSSMQGSRLSSVVLEVPILLTEAPASEAYPVYYDAVFTRGALFNGREIFPLKPDWSTNPTITYSTDRTTLDYEQGVVENYDLSNLRYRLAQYTFTQMDYASTKVATDFFFRMKGMQKSFYLPTWCSDMELAVPFAKGATTLTMVGADLFNEIGTDATYRNIALMTPAGIVPLSFNSMGLSADGLNTVLYLNGSVPDGVGNVFQICWLNLVRFATDTLSVAWLSSQVAQWNMTFKTLPDTVEEITVSGFSMTLNGDYVTILDYAVLEEEQDRALFGGFVLLINDNYLTIGDH